MNKHYKKLLDFAEQKGCRIIHDDTHRICFNANMSITVPIEVTRENLFALAHEIGHLIDYVNGELDHAQWLHDDAYRITAEMSAWVNAHRLLKDLGIPTEGYRGHVDSKLSSYFKYEQVI
ncbi:hypothetical protein [Indiicoccus explosivorum]|uniref:hypothetical protein n=1 Tax=Indiicoccus explosivorum TaxID=1917864 RepID=UPI000B44075C|nr:hypothetical protein [Indiicoccus explosivorum]